LKKENGSGSHFPKSRTKETITQAAQVQIRAGRENLAFRRDLDL